MIYHWVEKFRKYGTVQNLNCKSDDRPTHSGRPKKRTAEVIETVRNSVDFSLQRSIKRRKQSLFLGGEISASTVRRVLIDDLKRFLYRIDQTNVNNCGKIEKAPQWR